MCPALIGMGSMNTLAFVTDAQRPIAIGLIVLQVDETIETEFRAVFNHIPLYHTRIPSAPVVTAETLARMEADIPGVSALLPPAARFGAIGYACTSAAAIIGSDRIAAAVQSIHPDVPISNPLDAALTACDTLGVRRLGLITPYIETVSHSIRDHFENNGLSIAALASFEREEDRIVAQISEESILDAILQLGARKDIDAVFVSCTNLRTFNIIATAEAEIGKAVLSSNQVLAWHLLRLAGYNSEMLGLGILLQGR